MVSTAEKSPSCSDPGNLDGRDGPEAPTTPCGTPGTHQSDQVLRYEESEQYNGSDALEDPVGHAERPADVRNEGPSRLSSVDARCWTVESPLTTAVASRARTARHSLSPPAREPPPLRDILCGAILGAQLTNDSCWCWANAGLLCTLWALLGRSSFSLDDFGSQLRPVRAFRHRLQTMSGTSVALSFPDLLSHAAQKCMPRDVGEFVSELVDWLESQAISMTWERRFLAGSKVERPEAGAWQHPIALDCLCELDISTPTMTQLLQPWIHAESMIGTLKCIYIDRAVMLMPALGHNNPIELEDELSLPFFTDARTVDLTWIPHVPASGVVELGSRTSGHFITFLKAWNPPCWYELEDAKKAKMHKTLPTWAKERLVLIWYCPAHAVPDSSYPSASDLADLPPLGY